MTESQADLVLAGLLEKGSGDVPADAARALSIYAKVSLSPSSSHAPHSQSHYSLLTHLHSLTLLLSILYFSFSPSLFTRAFHSPLV